MRVALLTIALILIGMDPPCIGSGVASEISLEEIWALDMPSTKPMDLTMSGSPLSYESPEGALVAEIVSTLHTTIQRKPAAAGTCFAVAGRGLTALRAAHKVLVEGSAKQSSFHQGEQISLVFYSLPFNAYVHLHQVEQRTNTILLHYRFVPHRTKEMTAHLALIPLVVPMEQQIQFEVKPMEDKSENTNWERWSEEIVCSSFLFSSVPN